MGHGVRRPMGQQGRRRCVQDAGIYVSVLSVSISRNVNEPTCLKLNMLYLKGGKKGNILFNDALNTFYFTVI